MGLELSPNAEAVSKAHKFAESDKFNSQVLSEQ